MQLFGWLSICRSPGSSTAGPVNGKIARASYEVKEGDVIAIRFGERTLTVEVLAVQDNVGKAGADALYREV